MTTKVSSVMQEDGSEAIGLVPIGTPVPTFRTTAPDANWLFCFGQPVSRTTYAVLFAAIGTVGGAGDGSTTFNVPDMRGRVALGRDNMGGTPANRVTEAVSGLTATSLGAVGGDQRLQSHNHGVTDPGHTHSLTGGGGDQSFVDPGTGSGLLVLEPGGGGTITSSTTGLTVNNAGSGASQNVQPSIVVNWMIRAL